MSAAFESEELLVLQSIFGEDCVSYQPAGAKAVANGKGRGGGALLMFCEQHQGEVLARRGLSSVIFYLPPGYPDHVPATAAGTDAGTNASTSAGTVAGGDFEFDIVLHGCAPKVCASVLVFRHTPWFIVRHPHPFQHSNNPLITQTCTREYTAKCAPPWRYARTAHNSRSYTPQSQYMSAPPLQSNIPYARRQC